MLFNIKLYDNNIIALKNQLLDRYNFMLFCAFKMAVAFAFLCKNAVEAIYAQNH